MPAYIQLPSLSNVSWTIMGVSSDAARIIWNPNGAGLISIGYGSDSSASGESISMSQLTVTSNSPLQAMNSVAMLSSECVSLIHIMDVHYIGVFPPDSMSVYWIDGNGESVGSSDEMTVIIENCSGQNGEEFLFLLDVAVSIVRNVQVSGFSTGLWYSVSEDSTQVQQNLIDSVQITNYQYGISVNGEQNTLGATQNSVVKNSHFTCGTKGSTSIACDQSILTATIGTIEVTNCSFSDTAQMSSVHVQPTFDGLFILSYSQINGGSCGLYVDQTTVAILTNNEFIGPFVSNSVVISPNANQWSMTVADNQCSGHNSTMSYAGQSCSTGCFVNNNTGCAMTPA